MHLLDPYFQISPDVLQKIARNQDTAPQFSLDHFTDKEAEQLVRAIIDSTQMNTLYLYFTEKSLYTPTLTKFLCDLNQIPRSIGLNLQNVKLENACVEKLSELLANNKLHLLSINNCSPALGVIHTLLKNAIKSSPLRELHLAKNKLGNAELALVCQSLAKNNSLQVISLYHNDFTDEAIQLFATALVNNKCIHTIDLSFNNMQNATATQLLDILIARSEKCPIKSLSLANTKLTDAATEAICALLEKTAIEKLDISGNFFSETSLKKFHAAMRANHSLKEFKLAGNAFFPGHSYTHNPDLRKHPEQKQLLDEIKLKTAANKK